MTAKTNETLSARQVAGPLGTDPKTLRTLLRASDDYQAVGAGAEYAFTTKDVGPMKTRFTRWVKERKATKAARAEAAATAAAEAADPTPGPTTTSNPANDPAALHPPGCGASWWRNRFPAHFPQASHA